MKKQLPSQQGQALVVIALAAIAIFAFAALAIDGSMVFSDRRHAQNAADTAVLDAALSYVRDGESGPWISEGEALAATNGYDNNGTSNLVYIYRCDEAGATCTSLPAGADPTEYIQVRIISHVSTYFARVIGITQITNRVEAVAKVNPTNYDSTFQGNAVVGLSPHDCHAVTYQGNANTTVTGGGIFVSSDCANSAFFNNSNSADLTAPSLCAVGGIDYNPGAINVPDIETGCDAPGTLIEPNPTCSGNAVETGNTLSPGNVSGQFPPNGITHLDPGIYCVDGDFRVNGGDSLTGIGVVIRMNDGVISWNGGAEVHLEAPTEGPYAGLLIYMPSNSNCSATTINGNADSVIVGTILAPCSDITVNGTGDSGIVGQLIGDTIDLGGTSANSIHFDDLLAYDLLIQPEIELNQ